MPVTTEEFEHLLDSLAVLLSNEASTTGFTSTKQFEQRVRTAASQLLKDSTIVIDLDPKAQAFPDIAVGEFGIEVKFTEGDNWRCVANSVQETNRVEAVKHVYVMYGKMGGQPGVRWKKYEDCVVHVRTSHVPRFEVDLGDPDPGGHDSLFSTMGVSYDAFRSLEMHEKMIYIRDYARSRRKEGERLWWLEDEPGEAHSLPIQARLYTGLEEAEKTKLRAEAILLCPQIVKPNGAKHKYDDVALYLLTYHGVLCHQTRDLFSAGSVANPDNDDNGGLYIARALKLMEPELIKASLRMEAALFEEYWGCLVDPEDRITEWLKRADAFAKGWMPSEYLFQED